MKLQIHPLLANCPPILLKEYVMPLENGDSTRIYGLKGGRASGKTQTALRRQITKILQNPNWRVVAGRTTDNRKDTIKQTLQEIQDIEHSHCGIVRTTDKYVEFQNGGRLELKGFNPDVPESARGFAGYDEVIIDECFTGDTMVATPKGNVRIDSLKKGDKIISAIGEDEIVDVAIKNKNEIVEIKVNINGKRKIIKCSRRHKFLTTNGWCYADQVGRGTEFISIQDMPRVWLYDNKTKQKQEEFSQNAFLLSQLLGEARKCYAFISGKRKSITNIKKDWAQTAYSWWKRTTNRNTKKLFESIGERMGNRSCHSNKMSAFCTFISHLLQSRFGKQTIKISNRIRRWVAFCFYTERTRQEKRPISSKCWVESIKIKKSGSGVPLYDLAIKGHPSYFVAGILTHNCQFATAQYLNEFRDTILRFRTRATLCYNPQVDDQITEFLNHTVDAKTILCNYIDNPMCPESVIAQAEQDKQENYNYYLLNWLGQPQSASDMAVFQPQILDRLKSQTGFDTRAYFGALDFAPGSHDVLIRTDDNVLTTFGATHDTHQCTTTDILSWRDNDHLSIVGRVVAEYHKKNMQAIIVDSTGAGELVPDLLEQAGCKVIRFYGGDKNLVPLDEQKLYLNNRVYSYFLAAKDARENRLFCTDEQVLKELGTQEYRYTTGGLRQMQPKSEIKKKTGRSPDHADSFTMGNLLYNMIKDDLVFDNFYENGYNNNSFIMTDDAPWG